MSTANEPLTTAAPVIRKSEMSPAFQFRPDIHGRTDRYVRAYITKPKLCPHCNEVLEPSETKWAYY